MYTYPDMGALVLNSYPTVAGAMPGDRYDHLDLDLGRPQAPAEAHEAVRRWDRPGG